MGTLRPGRHSGSAPPPCTSGQEAGCFGQEVSLLTGDVVRIKRESSFLRSKVYNFVASIETDLADIEYNIHK